MTVHYLSLILMLFSLHPGLIAGQKQVDLPYHLYFPVVYHIPAPNFESEPNNSRSQADGPLQSEVVYTGYPGDTYDIYFFDTTKTGALTATLTNHTGVNVQFQLHSTTSSIPLRYTYTPPYILEYNITQSGRYYFVIYTESGFNTTNIYQLKVTIP